MQTSCSEAAISIRNILFPTDFSRESISALPYALAMAHGYGSKLYPVHVGAEPFGAPSSVREGFRALGVGFTENTEQLMTLLQSHLFHVPYEILFRTGDIWTELSDIIREKQIDLIVTGTHGRNGIGKLLAGSVAETIFRHAPCPVLTVGPAVSGEVGSIVDLHEILFATDFSKESLAGLPYAVSLAKHDDARLYLVHAAGDGVERSSEALLQDQLRNLVPDVTQLSCEPRTFVQNGAPAEAILGLADELAVDLIVMGVRRPPSYFEASRHLRLATAYAVASHAVCPLLTVRAQEAV